MMPTSMCVYTNTTLAIYFDIVWMQVDNVSLGEDEKIVQQLLFFLPHVGGVSFVILST